MQRATSAKKIEIFVEKYMTEVFGTLCCNCEIEIALPKIYTCIFFFHRSCVNSCITKKKILVSMQ
jgi:hypothetical protein